MGDADRGKGGKRSTEAGPRVSISCMEFSEGTRCSWNSRHRGPPRPRLHGSANFLPALITSSSTLYQTRVYRRTVLRPLSALFLCLVAFPVPFTSMSFPKFLSSLRLPYQTHLSFQDIPLGISTRGAQTRYTDDASISINRNLNLDKKLISNEFQSCYVKCGT